MENDAGRWLIACPLQWLVGQAAGRSDVLTEAQPRDCQERFCN